MNRLKNIALAALAAAGILLQSTSCEKYILPSIKLSCDTLYFTPGAGTLSATVNSTVKCTLSQPLNSEGEPAAWASCEWGDFTGRGETQLNVTVTENTASRSRTATIAISSEAINKKLIIIQSNNENE